MPGLIASGRSNQAATPAATPRLVAIRKCLVYACRRYLCPRVSGGNPSIPDRMHTSSCVSLGLPHQDTGSEQYGTAFRSTPGGQAFGPNTCSRDPGEVAEDEANDHPGKPGQGRFRDGELSMVGLRNVETVISNSSKTSARSKHHASLAPLVAGPPVVIVDSLSSTEFIFHINVYASMLASLSLVNAGHCPCHACSGRRPHTNCGGA